MRAPLGIGKAVKLFIGSSGLAATFVTAAFATYGISDVSTARIWLMLAGVVLVADIATLDYLRENSWKHVCAVGLVATVMIGSGLFWLDHWAVSKRTEQEAHTTPPPLTKILTNPPKLPFALQKTAKPPVEKVGPSNTVVGNQNVIGNEVTGYNNTVGQGNIRIDQHTEGNNSPITNSPITVNPDMNPYAPAVTYSYQGVRHITQGGLRSVDDALTLIWEQLSRSFNQGDLKTVISIADKQIAENPGWLAPYVFSGMAYSKLCDKKEAMKQLEHVEMAVMKGQYQPEDKPRYDGAIAYLSQLRNGNPEGCH